ncbi:MAG: exosome complex protein Rrp42 [Nanopusillaceae archaeon]
MDTGLEENIANYIRKIIKNDLRLDKRSLFEYREIKAIKNYSKNAEGSCYLELGKTKVLAGVKLEVSQPFPDQPDQGILVTNVEISPVSHIDVEIGPSEDSIEYSRVVDRIIRESRFINYKDLVIEPGKYVWSIFLDIYVLNDDGNIVDASVLASIIALKNTYFPKLEKTENGYKINYKEKTNKRLPLSSKIPFMFTFAKIDNKFILDPTKYEEEASDLIIHIGITDEVNALQTRGSGSISLEEFDFLLSKSFELREKLLEKISSI